MKENSDDFAIGQREEVERLVRLRQDPEAVPAIMLQLRAQKMGPADYLRTKREVQAFVVTGGSAEALDLLSRAALRREEEKLRETQRETQTQRENMSP